MTTSSPVPRPVGHLRVFLVSLGMLVLGLGVFIFGVSMESTASAEGIVLAQGAVELRSPTAGLIQRLTVSAGDEVAGGKELARIQPIGWWRGTEQSVGSPEGEGLWLIATVDVAPGQAVAAGQRLLSLIPLDPQTRRPRELLARLRVREDHVAEVRPGQKVRVSSNLFNERIHGKFQAEVKRIDPVPELGADGKRYYPVLARLEPTGKELRLGSGLKAEIVLGRKPVYRIILEH